MAIHRGEIKDLFSKEKRSLIYNVFCTIRIILSTKVLFLGHFTNPPDSDSIRLSLGNYSTSSVSEVEISHGFD